MVLIAAALLGSGVMSFRQMGVQGSQIRAMVGQSAMVEFQITTDPVQSAPHVFGTTLAPRSFSFLATALKVSNSGISYKMRVPIRVIASDKNVLSMLPGQRIRVVGVVKIAKESRVAVLLLTRGKIVKVTDASRWARSLGGIRTNLRDLSKHDDAGALIPGMVLGDTSLQSVEFKAAMRRSGLTHLVAVSGANFAIISLFVLWCMQWVFKSIRIRLIFTALALLCFIALVRPSPSVLRAAAMASVVLAARGTGRRADALPALGFAIGAVVIGDPWQAREPGFALSVLATAGLLLLAPRIGSWLKGYLPKILAEAISPPLAAVVMCAPILIALTGYLGLMTVIANLLVAPVVAPITIIGFIAALISPIAPSITSILLWVIHFPSAWIANVAQWSAKFPVLQLGSGLAGFVIGAVVLCILAIAMIISKRSRRILVLGLVIVSISFFWLSQWPGGEWDIANCDVGQGDSLVINLGGHRGLVIDAGPDAQLEDRCLHQLGISTISLLVLTHFHADHVEGLVGLLHDRKVEGVWITSNPAPILESRRVHTLLEGIPITEVTRGYSATIGGERRALSLNVLWPNSEVTSTAELPGDGSAINNSSVALTITASDFTLFSGGDIEPEVQAQLLPVDKVDIYKVSHHGSSYQDAIFMRELSPALSLISVGLGNTYGHPSARTIAALVRLGSKVFRTDTDGAIAVEARDHVFAVRTSGGRWWKKVRLS
ncbi:MAG: ComEC/Rec2 family competence protein [Actinobacteria bacterium]|nr:ComEC/Rec2 family competence protein [Actinomycetota bacterium]